MKDFKISAFWLLLFAFALAAYTPNLRAESEEEKEAAEAKEEEDKDKANDSPQEVAIKGRVTLNPLEDGGNIPVVAGLITSKDKSYLLKLKDPKSLRGRLVKVGDKEVQLRGFFRNNKKYLVVTDVDTDALTPPAPSEGL